ncbi:MAG: M13 family metallopeptidase [Bacteroidetes bacterium]|nr:M13 family metallopeptidase [Bacteroidota bacterium]
MKKMFTCLTAVALLSACKENKQAEINPGINLSYMDTIANPREDFYSFCNGTWQSTFELPESDARFGTFNEVHERNLKNIQLILDKASKKYSAAANTDEQRLRDFYNTAMDSAKADELGIQPIEAQLAMIDKVKNLQDFFVLKNEFDFTGIKLLFDCGVSPDLKNSRKNSFGIGQSGYGLGDRDYYHNPANAHIQNEYKNYLAKLFTYTNVSEDDAKKNAERVFEFEKQLTHKAFTRLELRDIERQYNVYSQKTLRELASAMNWDLFFKSKNSLPDTVIVEHTEYIKALNALLTEKIIETLKLYAKAQLLMSAAPFLSSNFVETSFAFRGKVLSGAKKMKPRWQRVYGVIDNNMGDMVAREFVKKHFTPEAKEKMNVLIDNLIDSYRERIATRTWMSDSTKQQANRKLDLIIRKIGYPDTWEDYSKLEVATDNYWANVCRAAKFRTLDELSDLKKTVDRNKWQMTAPTVNAYYNPTTNEICFPAGILQPPYFDANADAAANYGAIGSVIGHELTHGFDDQGSQFDADGNMKMWWTETDFENFKSKTQKIIEQFNNYVLLDSLHVNGSLTQGENIADLGGLTMSYYAYKKSLNGLQSPVIRGFTGEQRFFIAWAQGWKLKARDEEIKRLVKLDPHALGSIRAYAPLTNMSEFYEAFHVEEGDNMFTTEEDRVEIW